MKTLNEYIKNSFIKESEDKSTKITFNFSGLDDNLEEVLKDFENEPNCEIDGEKLIVNVNLENSSSFDNLIAKLEKFNNEKRNSPKRASDEQFAQKTAKFDASISKLKAKIEELTDSSTSDEE